MKGRIVPLGKMRRTRWEAHASAGDGALAIANFPLPAHCLSSTADQVRLGGAPKPAREARALPKPVFAGGASKYRPCVTARPMNTNRFRHLVGGTSLLLCASLLASCATHADRHFADVQNAVGSRTGKGTHWIRNGEEAAAAHNGAGALLSRPLTADSAAQIALLNNRRLQAAFEEIGISAADYLEAILPANPSFNGSLLFPHQDAGKSLTLSIAQDLLDLLLIPVKRKIARAQLEVAKNDVARQVLELITEAKTAFYNLQARQQLLGRLKLIVATNQSSADLANRQHAAGNLPDVELANQQALYSQSRVDVAQTEAQIRSDRERLNRLMGVWGRDTNWTIGDQLPAIPSGEISLADLENRAIAQRFDIAMARQNVAAIGLTAGLQRGTRFLPGGINVGVERERDPEGVRSIGPTLNLRLPVFNQGQAALARLQAQYRQAQDELEAISVEARSEVREARDLVFANRDLATYYGKVLLPQRIQIVNTTQLQYNAMQRTPTDLLLAKERELTTERGYIEAWRDYWISRAELEMALKGGSPRGAASASLRSREAGGRRGGASLSESAGGGPANVGGRNSGGNTGQEQGNGQ